jgi:hypothetical protein
MSKYIVHNFLRVATDFVPETFGRLTTLGPKFRLPVGRQNQSNSFQVCQCSCVAKTIIVANSNNLKNGNTKSCGCLSPDTASACHRIHGQAGSQIYALFCVLIGRCYTVTNENYPDWGGRGIGVCARWREPNGQGFINFCADMGPRPGPEYSINRKNNDGNYCPENCEWSTSKEQGRNKRNNRMLTAFGRTQCMAAWAEEIGTTWATLSSRKNRGWSDEKTLTTPVKPLKSKRLDTSP